MKNKKRLKKAVDILGRGAKTDKHRVGSKKLDVALDKFFKQSKK